MKGRGKNNILLMVTAFIWGSAFVAHSAGMEYIGPFTFNAVRCLLGAAALLPVIWILDKKKSITENREVSAAIERKERHTLLLGGLFCGCLLGAASTLQQIGMVYTSAGKAGFITALYILLVPIFGIFLGKKAGLKIWAGVILAIIGMYFLCITQGFTIGKGDLLVCICSVIFSVHILVIDYYAPRTDGVKLSCIQFLVSGLLCAVPMFFFEKPSPTDIGAAWLPLFYAGVLSCGVAYTLQILAQKNTDPTVASLILSLESVFAALTGWLVLGEKLSGREVFGCTLVFAAIILAQLPAKKTGDKEKTQPWKNRGEKVCGESTE